MKPFSICILFVALVLTGCGNEDDDAPIIKKDKINGFAQKGPLTTGSNITLNELEATLAQTGKSFNTQTLDNAGSYEFRDIELTSKYISLRADGFFFNEALGESSGSQISLAAVSDISDRSAVNINVLTHLEKPRVEHLVSQGIGFNDAKIQAQNEILNIFSFSRPDGFGSSEDLDITAGGDDNAMLLAASVILAGFRTGEEITALLSTISGDVREDGILNNSEAGSKLINHAVSLDTEAVSANLQKWYSDLGISVAIPDFGKFIEHFVAETDYVVTDRYAVIRNKSVNGFVQKGPFINGTSISINELNTDLSQTGKVFTTQIVDNKGTFSVSNIELASPYVSLRADGFYFNEVLGEQSASQITLYALSDISDKDVVNVNILSHLEKPRIEYLISTGLSFADAKLQAQREVLAIFNIEKPDIAASELLDISKTGDDNAILLATSIILQGYRTEGELTELLSNISTDLREDGVLNSAISGSHLINHGVSLNYASVRNILETRYASLGVTAEIPDFGPIVDYFKANTTFEITGTVIDYPASGIHGVNILDPQVNQYALNVFEFVSFAAILPRGVDLKVQITAINEGTWRYDVSSVNNWGITWANTDYKTQIFTAIDNNRACDLRISFDYGEFLIEYFEMGSTTPTRSKVIANWPPTGG